MSTAPSSARQNSHPNNGWRSLVRSLLPTSRNRSTRVTTAPTLIGIEGLPEGIGRLPEQVSVALVASDESSAALWLPALLEDAVAAGPVGLVASSTHWVDTLLNERATLKAAYLSGRLQLWHQLPGLNAQVKRHGLTPLLEELERTGLKTSHALYLCDAQALLSGLSVMELARTSRQLSALCRERLRPVVLAFFPPMDTEVLLPTLRNVCQMSMHIATLRTEADRWNLVFERWNTNAGALYQTAFGLQLNVADGRLTTDGTRTRGVVRELIEAVDQWDVVATHASVRGQRGVPSHWRIIDSLDDIEVAAASSIAGTVLIDAGQASDFESLTRMVHHLRTSRPLTLKIVVRENLGKLRTHSEQALMQLGASAVVYKEVGFSRLLQVLQDINAQSHTRTVPPDYEHALDMFMPTRKRGYQPPEQFCTLVRGMLERTRSIGLSHSIVRLRVLAQIPHLDALRACRTSRDGDLFTADHESVYIFLFACREPDVELALNRLFALPLAQLFASETLDSSGEGIYAMVDRLHEAVRKGLADYSNLLDSAPQPMAPQPTVTQLHPTDVVHTLCPDTSAETLRTMATHADALPFVAFIAVSPTVQRRPIARRAVVHPSTQSIA